MEKKIRTCDECRKTILITSDSLNEFEDLINEAIKRGWQLYGEPCLNASDSFYAKMVKYEEEKNNG